MAEYGGIWLDATVFITYQSCDHIKTAMSYPFYTQRFNDPSECPGEPCLGLWCNFYFMGKHDPKIRIFQFVYDSLLLYWETYDYAFNYVFLDYIIWAGYRSIEDIRQLIDNVPENNSNMWEMAKVMNNSFDELKWNELMTKNDFYKLSYKGKYVEMTNKGEPTNYAAILQNNLK